LRKKRYVYQGTTTVKNIFYSVNLMKVATNKRKTAEKQAQRKK
jgi:hypothetical protein